MLDSSGLNRLISAGAMFARASANRSIGGCHFCQWRQSVGKLFSLHFGLRKSNSDGGRRGRQRCNARNNRWPAS